MRRPPVSGKGIVILIFNFGNRPTAQRHKSWIVGERGSWLRETRATPDHAVSRSALRLENADGSNESGEINHKLMKRRGRGKKTPPQTEIFRSECPINKKSSGCTPLVEVRTATPHDLPMILPLSSSRAHHQETGGWFERGMGGAVVTLQPPFPTENKPPALHTLPLKYFSRAKSRLLSSSSSSPP